MTKGKAQQTVPLALVFTRRRRYYVIKGRQIDAYVSYAPRRSALFNVYGW